MKTGQRRRATIVQAVAARGKWSDRFGSLRVTITKTNQPTLLGECIRFIVKRGKLIVLSGAAQHVTEVVERLKPAFRGQANEFEQLRKEAGRDDV